MTVKRVGVLSLGVFSGALGAVGGLLIGLFYLMFAGVFAAALSGGQNGSPGAGGAFAGLGIAALFIFPIFYGVGGFINGLIGALIFNLVAGMTGGLKMDVQMDTGQPLLTYPTPPSATDTTSYRPPSSY